MSDELKKRIKKVDDWSGRHQGYLLSEPPQPNIYMEIKSLIKELTEREAKLSNALHELSNLYVHAFDLVDGGLIMLPSSVELFEIRHAAAEEILKELGLSQPDKED